MGNFLISILLFGLIFWVVLGYKRGISPEGTNAQELVRDATTGVYFPKNEAISITRGGETIYFLTIENRDTFLNSGR